MTVPLQCPGQWQPECAAVIQKKVESLDSEGCVNQLPHLVFFVGHGHGRDRERMRLSDSDA